MPMTSNHSLTTRTLLGTAVGDALGLKGEGLPRRAAEQLSWGDGPFLGRAVLSDDTEQSFLVAQALLRSNGEPIAFRRALRWRLIGWLFAGPPGVGLGTARSLLKIAVGFRNGVVTAGNGAAMRSAIIGATYPHEPERIETLVEASTSLTHADPRAFVGALAIALAAGAAERGETLDEVLERVEPLAREAPHHDRWSLAADAMRDGLQRGDKVRDYAAAIGCADGVLGYVYDTVPVALYAWALEEDPQETLEQIWRCGGDTDTVGAIAGALLYARASSLPPEEWTSKIVDWPLTIGRVEAAGEALATDGDSVTWPCFLMPLRNICIFPLILFYAAFVMLPRKLRARLTDRGH